MAVVVQTRPRCPRNVPSVYVVVDDFVTWAYHTSLVATDATNFGSWVYADEFLAAHPELLPGVLYVKWCVA